MLKKRIFQICFSIFLIILMSGFTSIMKNNELVTIDDTGINNINQIEKEKISTIFLNAEDFSVRSFSDYVDAIVLFEEYADIVIQNFSPKHWYNSLNGFAGKIPKSMYTYLEHAWFVSSISENSKGELCQDDLTWGIDCIDAERVWGNIDEAVDVIPGNFAGQGITIGIIDSGIDYTHEDLDDQFRGLDDLGDNNDDDGNGYEDDFYGWNFLDNSNDVTDVLGHGTMVAGIIVAEDNNVGVIGVAPKANIVVVKIANSSPFDIDKAIAGIDYCIASNVDIISMSWIEREDNAILEDACQRAYNADIVLIGGSGNDNLDFVYAPAKYNTVISVGALMKDKLHNLLRWESILGGGSNYGDDLDLVAPGANIWTTDLSNDYYHDSGTSYACPMVSGTVALMLSANPDLTPAQIRSALISTAIKLAGYTFDSNGFNEEVGYGCVDAYAAVESIPHEHPPLNLKFFDEDGTGIYSWTAIDYPYDKVQTNVYYDGKNSLFHYEDTSHYKNWELAESPRINLIEWDGTTDLEMAFQFRCQSNYASSSVTQFRLRLYDTSTGSYVAFTNPTDYSYYLVYQSNRNGQTWISGYDSGWQSESFTIPAADLSQFAGTDKLVIRWGHYDSWVHNWYQREYLDYLILETESYINPPEPTPDKPRDLTGEGDAISQITLSWKSPLNVLATEYKIYKEFFEGFACIDIINHNDGMEALQYWTDAGLYQGIVYSYRISAVNADGVEGPYESWSGMVGPLDPTPDEPRDLTGQGDMISQITLSWKSPLNVLATWYKVYRFNGYNYVLVDYFHHDGNIETLQFWTNTGLSQGITYYYRVSAVNVNGVEGPYSSWSGIVGQIEPTPDAPRNLFGIGDTFSQITLIWKSPLNILATQYKIYKKIGSVYVHVDTINHNGDIESFQSWTDTGLTPWVTYNYRVTAVNFNGEEGPYVSWSGTV